MSASSAQSNAQDFARHAAGFADMLTGFGYWDAVGGAAEVRQNASPDNK
jgi:hypothetical protein